MTVKHKLGDNSFAFNQAASNDMGDNLSVTRIDYYMSNFVIIHDGGQTLNLPESVIILAKGSNNVEEYLGSFNVTNIEGITFSIEYHLVTITQTHPSMDLRILYLLNHLPCNGVGQQDIGLWLLKESQEPA
ncbi:MAG: hypothetical protein IPF67_20140 [Saprospiraceae bacterium]|nr:hypothetical protein [Candidatus Brachybacter algidus]